MLLAGQVALDISELIADVIQPSDKPTEQHATVTESERGEDAAEGSGLVSSLCPPELAMRAIEVSLTKSDLKLYNRRYVNNMPVNNDSVYSTWKHYKTQVKNDAKLNHDCTDTALETFRVDSTSNFYGKYQLFEVVIF